jgi:4-amino-4-deoxy-L-arabinose transferase-like glycosyltransferase
MAGYQLFGINEFSARLPSALAALLTVLLTYELGRRLFNAQTAFLAGVVVASAVLFSGSAHFANPDALLNLFTLLTFFIFYRSYCRGSPAWLVFTGFSTGLAVLAKGPVGVVLPGAVIGLFLLWEGQLRRLLDLRLLLGFLAFLLVVAPWCILICAETKAEFLSGFIFTHNIGRFRSTMERHSGPFYYYGLALVAGFFPWSVFLGPTLRHAWREAGVAEWWRHRLGIWRSVRMHPVESAAASVHGSAFRFLWCWIVVYFLFFSLSATKLPNYILPTYSAVALMTACFLERWRSREIYTSQWAMPVSLSCLLLAGLGIGIVLLVVGGAFGQTLMRGRCLPGLELWAGLGALPILGAASAWWCLRRETRNGFLISQIVMAVLFVGALTGWGSIALDSFKAPRDLVQTAEVCQPLREIRVGCYQYYQPSLVFYCQREVHHMKEEEQALQFLRCPLQVYLFVPATLWDGLAEKVEGTCHLVGRHRDLYRNLDVVVVTNQ